MRVGGFRGDKDMKTVGVKWLGGWIAVTFCWA